MTAFPNIPSISTKATPAEVRRAFEAVKAYLATLQQTVFASSSSSGGASSTGGSTPGGTGSTSTYNASIPPVITGFTATGAFNSILLKWDAPNYSNHAYTEIHRAQTDNLGQAVMIGTTPAALYSDTPPDSSTSVTYYYWVRNVSTSEVDGPFQATHGAQGKTADDPAYLLEVLAGEITESQLFGDLNSRIDLIDTPTTGLVDKVTTAQSTANAAQTSAATAQTAANTANSLLADIASDSKLTASEKQQTKVEWDGIVAEKAGIDTQADAFGITTEKTAYGTAYTTLSSYITPLLSSLTTTSDIVGATFRSNFSSFYSARQALLNKIAAEAGKRASWDSVSGIPYATIYNNDDSVALGFNPTFSDWTTTYPAGWGGWYGVPIKETTIKRVGEYAVKFVAAAATNNGLSTTKTWYTAPMPAGTFISGTIDVYVQSYVGPGLPGLMIDLIYTSGGSYRRTTVQVPSAATGVWQRVPFTARLSAGEQLYGIRIYMMASYSAMPNGGYCEGTVIFDNLRFAFFDSSVDNKSITVAADGTISGAGGGQVTITGLGGETPTGAQTKADTARTGAITDAKADATLANSFTENSVTTIRRPVGGSYSGGNNITGAIRISLPQLWTNTMMRFKIEVFNYATGKSFTAVVAGYNYSATPAWYQTSAQIIGNTAGDNAIRFGWDGVHACIWIGETTSVWVYPKVTVLDFQAGYSNFAISQWETGWSVSIVTTFGTVQTTYTDALLDANSTKYVGGVAAATLVDQVNNATSAVSTQATAIAGINAKYTVKVDVNGYVAGYGLVADANNGTPTSTFGVLASNFFVCSPGVTAKNPFVVNNGVAYMNVAMIQDATITSAKIQSLAADKVDAATLAAISANLGSITAGQLNFGSFTGYAWPASGTGAHLSPSGLLLGNYNTGQYFQVTAAGALSAPGLSISGGDATFSGNLAANTVTTTSINGNAVTEVTGYYNSGTSAASVTNTALTVVSLSVTTVGNKVVINANTMIQNWSGTAWSDGGSNICLYRGATLLQTRPSTSTTRAEISFVDTPPSGANTYSLVIPVQSPIHRLRDYFMSCISTKR